MILQKFIVSAVKKLPLSIKMIILVKIKVWHDDLGLHFFKIQNVSQKFLEFFIEVSFFQKFNCFMIFWRVATIKKSSYILPGKDKVMLRLSTPARQPS